MCSIAFHSSKSIRVLAMCGYDIFYPVRNQLTEGVVVTKDKKAFWCGWAVCASFIAGSHNEPSLIWDAISEHGVSLKDLEDAEVDDFDMGVLRPLFSDRPLTLCHHTDTQ